MSYSYINCVDQWICILLQAWWFLGTTVKREYNASGEGPPSKRQRLTSSASSAPSSTEKLFSSQIEDLVETIVRSTDEWPSHLLESLFSALELTMENNADLCATVNEYVVRYEELKRVKMRAKQEEDWSLIRWNVSCELSLVMSESMKWKIIQLNAVIDKMRNSWNKILWCDKWHSKLFILRKVLCTFFCNPFAMDIKNGRHSDYFDVMILVIFRFYWNQKNYLN